MIGPLKAIHGAATSYSPATTAGVCARFKNYAFSQQQQQQHNDNDIWTNRRPAAIVCKWTEVDFVSDFRIQIRIKLCIPAAYYAHANDDDEYNEYYMNTTHTS